MAANSEDDLKDQVQILKIHQETVRSNIKCLSDLLTAGIRTGGEFNTQYDYALSIPKDRYVVMHKLMTLVDQL